MKSAELRKSFLEFFQARDHTLVDSAPLVAKTDPTIMFNVAGMVQFKPLWAGLVEPLPYTRATSVQKCLRLEDIDVVGTDATHDTFFEMLGNFSFGDYQKEQAITWAWEFISEVMSLPKERLWVSVHHTDEEAASIWRDIVGIPRERVVYLGDEENFWGPAGGKGACGPSSEIFWDLKWKKGDPGEGPGVDEDRYTEIWNLVFPQFNQQEDGSRPPLKYRGVDTGAGLERMVLAAQNVETIFHTDLFYPLMQAVADVLKVKITPETWEYLAITADHVRAATFVIGEGVRPSNKEEGYVIRRVLRRAIGALYLLGIREPLLYRLSGNVTEQMRHVYSELEDRREQVALMIKGEEERFLKTLDGGMRLFEDASHAGKISGSDAFKLHDTHGFPIDLTKWLARHKQIEVDLDGFEKAMEGQREKSRAAHVVGSYGKFEVVNAKTGKTNDIKFVGYDKNEVDTIIQGIEFFEVGYGFILKKTPFYAEAGGQVGDTGELILDDGTILKVVDTQRTQSNKIAAIVKMSEPSKVDLEKFNERWGYRKVKAIVDTDRRAEIERAHTATHLLHAALRKVLGEHVKQEGSLVEPGRLRFDFYHPSPMTREEIAEVEKQVYAWIIGNHQAEIGEMSRDQAAKLGALAFFGEKYGEDVRVIQIKNKRTGELLSAELCGGTHLERTGDVGMFLVTAETGVAAGIRRIEALVGNRAWEQMADIRSTVNEISGILKTPPENVVKSIEELRNNLVHDSKAREQITREYTDILAETILSRSTNMDGVDFVTEIAKSLDRDGLRLLADALKSRRQKIVGILAAPDKNGRLAILCFSSKPTETDYDAGQILKHVAKKFKGGGGGKSTLAEGSIAETSLDKLTSIFKEAVTSAKDGK